MRFTHTWFILLFVLFLGCQKTSENAFFTVSGIHIIDPSGQVAVLKGVGLGGWLMPEGYMLKIAAPDGGSPTTIENQIRDLIGEQETQSFFEVYRQNYVQQVDIQAIAEIGYDHIRLPFHYKILYDPDTNTFNKKGFDLVDRFLTWCKEENLGVILDMHATPGAQNHLNISDSDGTARLWTEPVPYQDQTTRIWQEIAHRYKDETIIIGYDLVNEPVLPEGYSKEAFRAFYVNLIQAVREIDNNHIVFVEGDWFATDFEGLTPPMDSNMVYAFHKYWNNTAISTVQHMLDIRESFQVPLWLGETGENSNSWFYEVSTSMLDHDIGWNWWTHKKYDTVTAPWSVPKIKSYEKVLNYWRGNGSKPTKQEALNGLMEFAEALKLENCNYRPDMVASLFSQYFNSTAVPYANHEVPGQIPLVEYDIGNQGISYFDHDYINESGKPGIANKGRKFRNDGVDIGLSKDGLDSKYFIGWTQAGEWLTYTFDCSETANYSLNLLYALAKDIAKISIEIDGQPVLESIELDATGSDSTWTNQPLGNIQLSSGQHRLKISIVDGDLKMSTLYVQSSFSD